MFSAMINSNLQLDYAGVEAINTICSNLLFSKKSIGKFVVTSCEANDGKTFISLQIAANMAKRGKSVLLIDADLRMSVMLGYYKIRLIGNNKGLAHLLSGQCQLDEVIYETNIHNMYLIPTGADVQAPLSLIATPDFENLIKTVGERFDLVIIDAPPVGLVIDAAEISKQCDGSVLVLEYNKTRRRMLLDAKRQMERSGTPILGCILNKMTTDRLKTKKYYYDRYNRTYRKPSDQ